jgi:phosphopantetheinyl transferase
MAPVNTTISTTGNVIIDIELEKQEPKLVKWFKGLFDIGTERDNLIIESDE